MERLDEAVAEFSIMIQDEDLKDSVFLLLANKQDLPGALTLGQVHDKIQNIDIKQRFRAAAVSVKSDLAGLEDSIRWLAEQLKTGK